MTFAALAVLMGMVASAANEADIAAFREARFGMFIHWGLYAQLGGRWKGQKMDYIGEWIQSRYQIPNAEYAKLAKDFNPVKFDADEWARQAKDAGMEYVVFTTKHHEGFSMYATKVSDYNIVDATPFKRDAFGELAAACRRHGLKVGLYYSQSLDWHERDAADPVDRESGRRSSLANHGMKWGNSWDFPDIAGKDIDRYLKAKVYPQLRELLTNYGEIFVLWFDCPWCMTKEQTLALRDFVKSLQPHALISSRIGYGLGDFGSLGDNLTLAGKCDSLLESPVTLNDTWGFKYDDHNWKTGYRVVCELAQTISCNANMLLNIGPRPDGRFPDASSDVLREVADWRRQTGFAIRGTSASPFPQAMPWGWCTVAPGNVLQFVVRSTWSNDLEVCGIRNAVRACTLPFEKAGETLRIRLPASDLCMPRVVRVTLDGAPDVDTRLMPQNGELILLPKSGGRALSCDATSRCRVTEHGTLTDWARPGDGISWKVHFPEAGRYGVSVRTETWAHAQAWEDGRTAEISIGGERLTGVLRKDRDLPHTAYDRAESDFGVVDVRAAGDSEVVLRTVRTTEKAKYQDVLALVLTRIEK